MAISFSEWKKNKGGSSQQTSGQSTKSLPTTGVKSFSEWKAENSPTTAPIVSFNDRYNKYVTAYNKYLSELDSKAAVAKQQYDGAVKTNKLANTMTFDPVYSGYATDELAASLLNTNKNYGKSVSNDELAKLYKNWQDADAEARQVRSEADYWKTMQKFGSSDAAIADYNKKIQAIKDNPEPWTNVSKSDPNKVKIEDLEKQRDSFIATDTRYKNAADDYAAIMAWQKGNTGTVGNYKQAQAAYNKAQAELDALQSMMPKHTGQTDTSGMNEQIAAAVRKRDRAKAVMDYAYIHRYEDLKNLEDYDLTADKGKAAFQQFLEEQHHRVAMGTTYDEYGTPTALNEFDPLVQSNFADQNKQWSEEEKNNFYYLFASNQDAAFRYGNEINEKYKAEEASEKDLRTQELAQRDFGAGFITSLGSVPATIGGGLYDYMNMVAENQARGDVYESQYSGASRWAENVRGSIGERLNSEYGTVDIPLLGDKGLGDVYQLFMSMADSSVSVMAGGGVANLIFFGSAAASATRDALDRGMSGDKAIALGFANGINEVIGETFSVEHLLKQGDIADFIRKGLLPMMLQQGAVEGSEELLTSFLNNLADKLISGDDSKFMQEVYVKMGNGMSYTDAVKEARMDQIRDYCTDVAGGFLSGSLMSGGKAGVETARAASTTYKGDVRGLLDVSKLTGEDSDTSKLAAMYQERYEKKGGISNLQAAKLEANAMGELQTKDRTALTTQVKQRLEALDVQNADKAAKAIVDRLLGEQKGAVGKLSDASIFKDSRVRIAYQEALEQLGGRNTTASWLDDSGLMTLGKDPAVGRTIENRLKLVKLKGSDERVEIKKAGMQGDNLTITYEQNGEDETVTTDKLDLDDYQREALQALVDILGDDAAYAFNGMRNAQRQLFTLQGISNYATEFAAIRDIYGRNGTNIETALKSPMRNLLSDGQVMQAYNRGKELGPVKTGDGSEVARGTGEISLEGGLLDGHKMGAVKDQESVRNSEQFKLLQRLAKRFGWDMVIYESEAVDKEGNIGYAPRGAYVQDGKIWLDWNAGVNNITKSTDFTRWMIFLTMSHEVTHFLEENAKKEYAELRRFIERHMAEHKGYTFADAMNRKMAGRIDAINRGEVDRNGNPLKPMSAEEAAREVIADACETMLVRSEYIGKMVEESPSLFMQLRKAIRAFFDTILGKDADGYNSSLRLSEETEAIQDVADEVSRLWDAALKAAVENRLSEEARDEIPSTDEQQAAGISSANEIINGARRRVLQDAKNPTAAAQQNKVDRIMRQLATVNRETPVPRQALPPHQEQQAQQEKQAPAPKLTAKEKAAIKKRFNDAVDKLMTSYTMDGIDISREDAERMVTEYAALHDGYFSELDEWQQKGMLKTQKQYARDFYETLEADEAEAFDNLEAESQELVARMGVGTTIEANEDGEMEIAVSEDRNTIAFSPRTYQDSGKAKLIAALKENGHTQEEIDAVTDVIEATGDFLEKLADQFANSHGYLNLKNNLWATVSTNVKTGKQVISTLVNNGDYPVNLDLQLICKKRVAYMRMLTRLIDDGVFEKVDFKGGAIADLNKVLRDGGFETACLGCFVEARRLQLQAWAETIVEEWNAAVDKRNPQAGSFNFAQGGNTLNQMEIAGLITELENAGKKNDKGNLNLGVGAVADKMGRLLDRVPSLQQHLTVADLLTPQGMSTLRKYDQNLFSLVKQRYGANSPKIVQDFNAYNSEIADLSFKFVKEMIGESVKGSGKYTRQAKKVLKREAGESKEAYNRRVETYAMRKYLYDIGGARIQSFSDFMIENVFDYMQIIADLSAREFPLHGYSKEAVFLRLFGMTGGKFNGSLIAHVDGSMGKEYAGLLPASEASNGRGIVVDVDGKKYAICFDDYARHVATGSFIQSIGMKDIVALQLDPRYSKNVGSITIGVSDKQILAMLDSPYFRMVIPYHSSGMLPEFARLVGVNFYNDYQDYQSTKVAKCFDRDGNPVEGFWQANGKSISIDTHFDFNEAVQRLGDAKAAADEYLEWCKQRHPVYDGKKLVGYATFTAKFSDSPYGTDFTTHPNYYKLLEDFNVYDSIGESSALQGAVTMTFPSEATRLTAEQMTAYKQALRDTGLYTEKEINKYAAKADMTFQEIIAEEIGNRAEYESKQAKVWDATVDKAETMLLEKYGREGSKVQLSARDFSYNELVGRGDLQGEVITAKMAAQLPTRTNGTIDLTALCNKVKARGSVVSDKSGNKTYYLSVPEISTNVEISNGQITHGFFLAGKNKMTDRDKRNALASLYMPDILANSIEVNRLGNRGNKDVPYSHVLMGVMGIEENGIVNYYAVRSVIEERINRPPHLVSYGITGRLYAINAKKIGNPHARSATSGVFTNRSLFAYSIADFLDDVKMVFDDTFSNDVYAHYGLTRHNNPKFSPLQYSARTQMNRDYMAAVERGDMETAQRMVDEAAAAAGYNRRAFHGTVSKFWTFRRGKEGIHFGTLEVAQQTLEKDRSRHGFSSYPLGIIRANLDRFSAEQLWNITEELWNLKWRGYSDIPSLDPKTVYDNAEAVRGYMDKILEIHPEARSDAKIDMKDMFNEHEDRVIDAYIKMQHPMTVPVDIGEWTTFGIANALLHKLNGTTDSFYKYNREEKTGDWKDWNPDDIKGIELTEADRPALENLAGHYKEYEELVDFLHSKGVDSIEYTNMYEGSEDNISYLLLDPEQVKLSDPVTYDDAGNVIPLSERFNSGTGDIRYSARTDAKSDRELLLDASEAGMTDAEKRAAADYKAKVDVFRQRQQAATAALDALDKAVQAGNVTEANKLRTKLTAAEKKMSEALAALTEAERGPELREILRREREIQRQRTTKRIRDSYTRRELRQRVDRLWKDLNKRITSPTEKKRIPVELMQQAIDVLQAINMDTTKEGSQGGQKLRNKLLELRARYTELQNDQDFRRAAVYDAQVAQYLDNMIEVVGDTPINRMSNEQLAAVFNVLQALDHTARNAVKIKLKGQEIEAYEVSKYMTAETRSFGKKKTGAIETWINAQLSPARMFNRFGGYTKNSYWSRVYDMLDDGQLKQTQLMMEGSLIFEDLLSGKDYEKFVDPKNTVDVGLKDEDGNNIVITHGMMVALYMHLQNEQNRRHVAYGGLTIPALKDYYSGKKVKGSENAVRVGGVLQEMADLNDRIRTEEDAGVLADLEAQRDMLSVQAEDMIGNLQATIETKLTDYDRQWIAASRELFDGFSKRVLNQTTLEIYGIKRANVENYMPIWVDGDFLNTPFESVAKDMSLENAGFMKERVDSSKPIRLADISDVTASQIRKVSQYCGLMPVIRAFNKVWGKTQTGYRDSLQKAVHETFGQAGVKYIENLMADLNGARGTEDSALGEFLNRMRGHMAQASLTLSLRTAAGQVASYPTAAAVLGWDAISKGITDYKKVDPKLIQKWSPLLYYRMKGYRDPELGNIAEMNSKWDRLWKKARWATGWIQAFDGFTVGQLVWSASEAYVQIHNKNLVKGTDAYYEAVAKKFNEAVELTQPNYTTMQRPDILRNPNALVKQLTMFLTQRLQNFNIVYDAAATYSKYRSDFKAKKNGVTAEDVRQAGVATRDAVLSQVAAAATIVIFKAFADFLLHAVNNYRDDDKELTKESISLELLDMFIDSLAGNVLGGGEVYDVIESKAFGKTYYGIEVTGVSTVTDLITTANTIYDHVANGKASLKDLDLLAKRLGPVAGIPYANAKKIIDGGRYWVEDAINGELFSFEAGVDRTTAQQAHRVYRAYVAKDYGLVNKIRDEVPEDKQSDLDTAIRSYIKQQYKDGSITFYEALRQMQSYGKASDTAIGNFIKEQYKDGKINKNEAINQLMKYAGKDKEAAEKTMREFSAEVETGTKFSDIQDQFLLGDLSASKAKQMLVKYGGMDADTAQMKLDFWTYQNKHAGTKLEFSSYKTYVNKYKAIGLTAEQYEDYSERLHSCKGVDANGDGKTDSGSKKKEVVALIASMNLTAAQKDQLYFANNYGASGLKDTPWHK